LVGRSWESVVESLPKFATLNELVDRTPSWFCKPYVRPQANADEPYEKPYRMQRNAELDKCSKETGLSKKQLRKRERRQIETKRKMNRKQTYPKCKRCQQPAGVNCDNSVCRKCCKWICVRRSLDCKSHAFDHHKMIGKRQAHAEILGLTIEELLIKEAAEDERMKALNNTKKEWRVTFSKPTHGECAEQGTQEHI